ncbi:MAG: hypothetical protein OCD01_19100 [Fibrobacterales bacterium]
MDPYSLLTRELKEIINNPDKHSPEDIALAKQVLTERSSITRESPKRAVFKPQYDSITFPRKPIRNQGYGTLGFKNLFIIILLVVGYSTFGLSAKDNLIIVVAFLVHEIGHVIAMKIVDYKNVKILLLPLLALFFSTKKKAVSAKQEMIILFAGPLPGLIIGCTLLGMTYTEPNEWFERFGSFFIILNLLMLLPMEIFDGGRIINLIYISKGWMINSIAVVLVALAMMIGVFYLGDIELFVVPGLLFAIILFDAQLSGVRKACKKYGVNIQQNYDDLTDKDYWIIRDQVGIKTVLYFSLVTAGEYKTTNNEDFLIDAVDKVLIPKEQGSHTPIQKFIYAISLFLLFVLPLKLVLQFL